MSERLSLQDWIEFEEIADLEERAKSHFFEKESEEEVQKSQAAAKEKEFQSVRAAKDQVGEVRRVTGRYRSDGSLLWLWLQPARFVDPVSTETCSLV